MFAAGANRAQVLEVQRRQSKQQREMLMGEDGKDDKVQAREPGSEKEYKRKARNSSQQAASK